MQHPKLSNLELKGLGFRSVSICSDPLSRAKGAHDLIVSRIHVEHLRAVGIEGITKLP